ncbi:stage III sporulation protein AG [Bacillus ectoiniformans]|uniref:stage III sporulation protein AG n=1 Tax=Bacillus ectoiniformans TaxID=1494429 RepID=UPI001958F300|nr:stage III sporulation protein AG [Bacillus ectoiniformans]MBM7650437.1 stage III sporulation protein AG [Bacillus ectoiniformans]
MSDRKKKLDWLQSWFPSKKNNEGGASNKTKWLVIAAAFGIMFMLISDVMEKNEPLDSEFSEAADNVETFGLQKKPEAKPEKDYESMYEQELKSALEEMAGVSNVTVVVNIEASEKKVFERNVTVKSQQTGETDQKGGERTIADQTKEEELVIVKGGNGDAPVVQEVKKPKIRGVLVVAEGVENVRVKRWVIEAVTRGLDVPSHRVAVMPKKSKGDL